MTIVKRTNHFSFLEDLIPTLLSLYTTRLTYQTLTASFQQVCNYVSKFRNRLGPDNMLHLKRLVVFLDALKKYTNEWKELRRGTTAHASGLKEKVEVVTVTQLLEGLGRKASGVNLLEIEAYLRRSKVNLGPFKYVPHFESINRLPERSQVILTRMQRVMAVRSCYLACLSIGYSLDC